MTDTKQRVLVTGISGYIAKHVAKTLLDQGYKVRGTVRDLKKTDKVKTDLKAAGCKIRALSFVAANLEFDDGWEDAVNNCDYILHLASPFPLEQPADREALVPAARAGTQRVLAAGFATKVKRIVLTSSLVSMMGVQGKGAHMTIKEDSWSDPDWKKLVAYNVSKTRAELSAWDYAEVQGFKDRLCVINPGIVLGPAIGQSYGSSLDLLVQMFAGEFPRTPKASYPIVDVRDLAALHVAAMTAKGAAGRRLIAAGETLWLREIAAICRAAFPEKGAKLPKGDFPDFIVRIAALFDSRVKAVLSDLGTYHEVDNAYVTELTGVKFRPAKDSIIDSVKYLISIGKI
ncbi:MAG TPA: NAD-dependent epimerase/dehydratase family protein [Hellea balneolensis]|uniref:NAD-dependent epimerase/dehydratase family protein n=1 Tax=Hellea balneolensis TaxID=287478 RepID=A0A7C5R0U9_9PROT|nr:NAD-dependent epimerase/dehydratase family protein [Hellea balneolensis]